MASPSHHASGRVEMLIPRAASSRPDRTKLCHDGMRSIMGCQGRPPGAAPRWLMQ